MDQFEKNMLGLALAILGIWCLSLEFRLHSLRSDQYDLANSVSKFVDAQEKLDENITKALEKLMGQSQ